MKYATLFTLPLAVSVSAAVLEPRQFKVATVAGIDKLKPAIRKVAGVQRTLTKFGPYTLKASTAGAPKGDGHSHGGGGMGMGGGGDSTLGGQTFFLSINKGFCNDAGPCTVYGGKVGVMYEDGTAATPENGVYIHHVLTTDTSKKAGSFLSGCDNTKPGMSISGMGMGAGFVGTGEDSGKRPVLYTREDGSSPSGYWVAKGDKFIANVVLVNYNKTPKNVFVTYDLEWAPGELGNNAKGMLIAVNQCRGKSIRVSQTGPTNTTSGKFTFLEDGQIIGARGHLHDGGVKMDMIINDKFVCASKASYGGDGAVMKQGETEYKAISGMSPCSDKAIPVKKGDTFAMVVEYDLQKHPLRKSASGAEATGVMGMWSITFEPTKSR